jgi:hypothetical protein
MYDRFLRTTCLKTIKSYLYLNAKYYLMRYVLILTIIFLLLLAGCQKQPQVVPNPQDNPEAFACAEDSDCVRQSVGCSYSGCYTAINKDYQVELHCDPDGPINEIYCAPIISISCINNTCTGIYENIT